MATVTIKGLSSLEAKLKKLEPLTRDAMATGVAKAGLLVEGAAKRIVPVDTSALRNSIYTNEFSSGNSASAMIVAPLDYAMYVELGTSRQQAQPYLQPSLQKNKNNARKLVMTEIAKAHRSL